jgi:hypothetical protein
MNIEKFPKPCMSMPGAAETVQWGNDPTSWSSRSRLLQRLE